MEKTDDMFKILGEICQPSYYGKYLGRMFTLEEVKMLCIAAAFYALDHCGDEKIDMIPFFKEKGL